MLEKKLSAWCVPIPLTFIVLMLLFSTPKKMGLPVYPAKWACDGLVASCCQWALFSGIYSLELQLEDQLEDDQKK